MLNSLVFSVFRIIATIENMVRSPIMTMNSCSNTMLLCLFFVAYKVLS